MFLDYIKLLTTILVCFPLLTKCEDVNRHKRDRPTPMEKYTNLSRQAIDVSSAINVADYSKQDSRKCNKFNCFDSLQCQLNEAKQLTYYIYPPLTFVDSSDDSREVYSSDEAITVEYWEMLELLLAQNGSRLTLDPQEACLFIPSLDLTYIKEFDETLLGKLFSNLPFWRLVDGQPGTNHIVIDLDLYTDIHKIKRVIGRAILVSNKHDTWTLRPEFDLSIPALGGSSHSEAEMTPRDRPGYTLVFAQYDDSEEYQRASIERLKNRLGEQFLVLSRKSCDRLRDGIACNKHNPQEAHKIPTVLSRSRFCLILLTSPSSIEEAASYLVSESLRRNCVPIIHNNYALPFSSLINWSRISISLANDHMLENLVEVLSSVGEEDHRDMVARGKLVHAEYFKSPRQIMAGIVRHYDSSLIYPPIFSRAGDDEL